VSERVRLDAEMWGGPYDGEQVRCPMTYPYRFFRETQDGRHHWYAYDPATGRAYYEGEGATSVDGNF
jgi:hypothetical protein